MVLLSIYLIFCKIQPGDAYKSVAYKKSVQFVKNTGHLVSAIPNCLNWKLNLHRLVKFGTTNLVKSN